MREIKLDLALKTVALADDDRDDSDLFAEALSDVNPDILLEKAPNGRVLLDKIASGEFIPPDIIFLDINMPEMNGWECLQEIRKSNSLMDVPVIMYSTSSNPSDKVRASQLGASFYFTKPDTYSDLKLFLLALIENPDSFIMP